MGKQQSKNGDYFSIRSLNNEINKFSSTQLTKDQFLNDLFSNLESQRHPIGNILIIDTFIMQRFYLVCVNNRNGDNVNCNDLKKKIKKMYKNPQIAIQYSFRLIDLDNDNYISKAQFLCYMDHSFSALMKIAQKSIKKKQFKANLKQWINNNKMFILQNIIQIFTQNLKSDSQRWTYGDYKRWIQNGDHWTFDIEMQPYKFRTPLNLLCMFAIQCN